MFSSAVKGNITEIPSSENALQPWGTMIGSNASQNTTSVLKFVEISMEEHEKFLKNKVKPVTSSNKGLIRILDDERSISILGHDPVGSHLIQLRMYVQVLKNLEYEASRIKYDEDGNVNQLKVKKLKQAPEIPPFPEKYPLVGSLGNLSKDKNKKVLTYKMYPSKKYIESQRKLFVERVLLQTGYFDVDEKATLNYLSDCVEEFLENIVKIFRHYKNSTAFADSRDLMKPLEVTFRAIGYGGIKGIHKFYYHNFIKKHDIMLKQCVTLEEEYRKKFTDLRKAAKLHPVSSIPEDISSISESEEETSSSVSFEDSEEESSSGSEEETSEESEAEDSEESEAEDSEEFEAEDSEEFEAEDISEELQAEDISKKVQAEDISEEDMD